MLHGSKPWPSHASSQLPAAPGQSSPGHSITHRSSATIRTAPEGWSPRNGACGSDASILRSNKSVIESLKKTWVMSQYWSYKHPWAVEVEASRNHKQSACDYFWLETFWLSSTSSRPSRELQEWNGRSFGHVHQTKSVQRQSTLYIIIMIVWYLVAYKNIGQDKG